MARTTSGRCYSHLMTWLVGMWEAQLLARPLPLISNIVAAKWHSHSTLNANDSHQNSLDLSSNS
eukprot:6106164-Amphidinium_carterae.1